jgi:hypothetical protein
VPELATSEAEMLAWSWLLLTYVVVRLPPFHRTTDVGEKFAPVTVKD